MPFLRRYDPDHILWLSGDTDPLESGTGVTPSDGPGIDGDMLPTDIRARKDLVNLATQVDMWCAPFKRPESRCFTARDIDHLFPASYGFNDFRRIPFGPSQIAVLDLSGIDPLLALMVESRIGAIGPNFPSDIDVTKLSFEASELPSIVRLAVTGEYDFQSLSSTSSFLDAVAAKPSPSDYGINVRTGFMNYTPFAQSLRWTIRLTNRLSPPVVCVVGNTAQDHALALICDRLFHHGVWVPEYLLANGGPTKQMIMMELSRLRHLRGTPERPILIVSASQNDAILRSLASDLNDMNPIINRGDGREPVRLYSDRRRFEAATLESLSRETGRALLADRVSHRMERTVPVSEENGTVVLQTPIQLSTPEVAGHLPRNIPLYIDVWLPGHTLPSNSCLSGGSLIDSPTALSGHPSVRVAEECVTFATSPYSFPGVGPGIASPLFRFSSAEAVFHEIATRSNTSVERSDAGRRAANAVELWGSFSDTVADLDGSVREILDSFHPPKGKRDGNYGRGYAIRGEGYVALEDIVSNLNISASESREMLDRLLAIKVLNRGLLLNCARCRFEAFYRVEEVGVTFNCQACGHSSQLARGRWYEKDDEPHWYYSLDQVVSDLIRQHGDIPLLAAKRLSAASSSVLWSPELVLQTQQDTIELDICLVVDGQIIVGEAKSNNSLKGSRGVHAAADRLVCAAQILRADQIVLATSQDSWARGTREIVEDSVARSWVMGARPAVLELVSVRKTPGFAAPSRAYQGPTIGDFVPDFHEMLWWPHG